MAISLITAKDVAEMLHYKKPDKVYLLVRSGLLKGFKRGRIWLIDKESVDKYIRQQLGYVWFLIIPFHYCDNNCDMMSRNGSTMHLLGLISNIVIKISKPTFSGY